MPLEPTKWDSLPRRRCRRTHFRGEHSGGLLAFWSRFGPSDVGRELRTQDGFERPCVRRDAFPDALQEVPVERHEGDGLPDAGPAFVPSLEPHFGTESPPDGALARAEGSEETSVRQGIGFEVQSDLDHSEPFTDPRFVMELLVARPELRHAGPGGGVKRWIVRSGAGLHSLHDAAEERSLIEPTECRRGGRDR